MTTCRSKISIPYDAAGQIKSILSIKEVAERYGVHFDEHGRALCPFHDDSHPSGSIKNGRFHCYVCNLHLDIFDFVEQLFDISFPEAVVQIDSDFGLGLTGKKPDRKEAEAWKIKKRRKEIASASRRDEYMKKIRRHQALWTALKSKKPRTLEGAWIYAGWQAEIEYLSWWLDSHPWK